MIWEQLSVVEQARFDKVNNPTLEANWWAPIQNGHPVERFATDCKCPVLVYKAMGQGIMDAAETYVLPDKGVQTVIPSEKPKEALYITLSERASPDTEMGLSSQQESASARKRTKTTGQGRSEQPILKSGIQDVATDDVVPSVEEKTQESKLTRSSDKRRKRSKPVTRTTTEPAASQLPMPSDTIETQKIQELPSSSGRMSLPTCIWNQLSKSERKLFTENKVSNLERGWYEPIESGYLVENLVAGLNRPVRVYEETEQGSQTKFLAYVDLDKVLHKELPPVIPRNVFRLTLSERAFADSEMRLSSQQERETARTETTEQDRSMQVIFKSEIQDVATSVPVKAGESRIAAQVTQPSDVQHERSESVAQTTVEPADSPLHLQDTGIIETEQRQELPSKIVAPLGLYLRIWDKLSADERERFEWNEEPALLESWKKPLPTGSGHPFADLAKNLKRPIEITRHKRQGSGRGVLELVANVTPDKGVLEKGAPLPLEGDGEKLAIALPPEWIHEAPVRALGSQQERESARTETTVQGLSMQPIAKSEIQVEFSGALLSAVKKRITGHLLHSLYRVNTGEEGNTKVFIGGSFGRKLQGIDTDYNDIDLYAEDIEDARRIFRCLQSDVVNDPSITSHLVFKKTGIKKGYISHGIPYVTGFSIFEAKGKKNRVLKIEVNLLEKGIFDEYMQNVNAVISREYTLPKYKATVENVLCLTLPGEVKQLIKAANQFCYIYLTDQFYIEPPFILPRTIIFPDEDKSDRERNGLSFVMRAAMTLGVLDKFKDMLSHMPDSGGEEYELLKALTESIQNLERKIVGSPLFKKLIEQMDQWISDNQNVPIVSYVTKLRDRLVSIEVTNPSLTDSDANAFEDGWEDGEMPDTQPSQLTDSVARLFESVDAYATSGRIPLPPMPAFIERTIHQWDVECGEIAQPMPRVWSTGGDSVTTDLSMQSLQPLEGERFWPGEFAPNFNVGEESSWVGGQMPVTQSLLMTDTLLMTDSSAAFCETVPYVAIPMLEGERYIGHRLIPAVAVWSTGHSSGAPVQPMPSLQPIEKLEEHELSPKKPPMRRHSM